MHFLKYFWFFILFFSCADFKSLNLKPHTFNRTPKNIIWIQLAGYSNDHAAMLRFGRADSKTTLSFENASCMSELWNYDLYHLRPKPYEGFLSQLTGRANIKGTCEDYSLPTVWKILGEENFKTAIFETKFDPKNSLLNSLSCPDNNFLKDIHFFKMDEAKDATQSFHYLERGPFEKSGIYYDKSCQGKLCNTSIYSNVKSVFSRFSGSNGKYIFIIRDFSYYEALKNKNISAAKEILSEIEKVYGYFNSLSKGEETLLLLTSSGANRFEFPKEGSEWAAFENSGKFITYRDSSLSSPLLASGPKAENFCGLYEENDIIRRILWKTKDKNIFSSIFSGNE